MIHESPHFGARNAKLNVPQAGKSSNSTPHRGREPGKPLAQIIVADYPKYTHDMTAAETVAFCQAVRDTDQTKARNKLVAMLQFEEAEHCEHFTAAERAAIMAAVNRVKAEAEAILNPPEAA